MPPVLGKEKGSSSGQALRAGRHSGFPLWGSFFVSCPFSLPSQTIELPCIVPNYITINRGLSISSDSMCPLLTETVLPAQGVVSLSG